MDEKRTKGYVILNKSERALVRAVGLVRAREGTRPCWVLSYVRREVANGLEAFVATDGRSLAVLERRCELPSFTQLYTPGGQRVAPWREEELGAFPKWRNVLPVFNSWDEPKRVDMPRVLRFTERMQCTRDDVWKLESGGLFFLEEKGKVFYYNPRRIRLAAEQLVRLSEFGFADVCSAYVSTGGMLMLTAEADGMVWKYVMNPCCPSEASRYLGGNVNLV